MEAKPLIVMGAILFLPSYYLWSRGYKKALFAFLGSFISLIGVLVGVFLNNHAVIFGSMLSVPLCFGLYFVFKHREKIFNFLRNIKKEYSIRESVGWCIPIAFALCADIKYPSYVFIAYIASCFFMNDFKGTFFCRVKFLIKCALFFWLMVVFIYIVGHVSISNRFY